MKTQERLFRISFIISGLVLIISSLDPFYNGSWVWGIIALMGGFLNLLGIKKSIGDRPAFTISIYLINAFLALFNMVFFIQRGSNYIHWVWMSVSIFYLLMSIIVLVRHINTIKPKSYL